MLCHRCHAELPRSSSDGRLRSYDSEDGPALFCPRCGAPQVNLPEHLRPEPVEQERTTGELPPPRPAGIDPAYRSTGYVDWHACLGWVGLVAGISTVLMLVGLVSPLASLLSVIWTVGGAVVSLALYARSRPQARMDAGVGMRVGAATGVMMIASMGLALAITGFVMRFGTHSLGGFDAEMANAFAAMREQWAAKMQDQPQPAELKDKLMGYLASPEFRAGLALFYLGAVGSLVLLLSTGGGALAGMLRAQQNARPGLRRGD
jgi:hypothetical protein